MKKAVKKALCSLLAALICFASISVGFVSNAVDEVNKTTYITTKDLESGTIEFGSYPQTKVTDQSLKQTLLKLAPSKFSSWPHFEYYYGNGELGSMQQKTYMYYYDVTYNGEKYRCSFFNTYRPSSTYSKATEETSYQDNNGYKKSSFYFFKFEPLKWRVLDKDTGLIVCESIIDSQPFNNEIYEINGVYCAFNNEPQIRANNYKYSSIRTWLNDDFYNTAFSTEDKTVISQTTIGNLGNTYEDDTLIDNIFLLGQKDVTNTTYGFVYDNLTKDTQRLAQGTDYAKYQGLYVGTLEKNSSWLLRTAYDYTSPKEDGFSILGYYNYGVNEKGEIHSGMISSQTTSGIRPALTLNLHTHDYTYKTEVKNKPTHEKSGIQYNYCVCGEYQQKRLAKLTAHSYTEKVSSIAPTCTESGLIIKACVCGAIKKVSLLPLGHNYGDDGVCTRCGKVNATDPTTKPSTDPTTKPSTDPTTKPSTEPTTKPSADPTTKPSTDPTTKPSADPTTKPSTDPTTKPSTDPTTKPSTDPTTKPSADPTEPIFINSDTFTVDDENKIIYSKTANIKAEDFYAMLNGSGWTVTDAQGNSLDAKNKITTRCILKNTDGREYVIVVIGDVNCDGSVTAADARITLRCAAKLDKLDDYQSFAADINGDSKIMASDARKILRVAAKLEQFK